MAATQGVVSIGRGPSTKTLPEMLALQMAERVELYTAVPPMEWLLPINLTPIPVPDEPPADSEIWEVVAKLQNGCAAAVTGMKAEHLKD